MRYGVCTSSVIWWLKRFGNFFIPFSLFIFSFCSFCIIPFHFHLSEFYISVCVNRFIIFALTVFLFPFLFTEITLHCCLVSWKQCAGWGDLTNELYRLISVTTLGMIGVGMGSSRGQVQILKIIANNFIRDTDYWENKAIVRNAWTLSVSFTTCRPCCNVLLMTVINAV